MYRTSLLLWSSRMPESLQEMYVGLHLLQFSENHRVTAPSVRTACASSHSRIGITKNRPARQKPERIASNPQVRSDRPGERQPSSPNHAPVRPRGRYIVEPALIEEVSGAVRTSGPREHGDRVNHQANVLCQPGLLGSIRHGCHRAIRCRPCVRDSGGSLG